MEHEELTKEIIGCAFQVYKTMKFGFLESVYEKCLMIELANRGLRAQAQWPISVFYNGHNVGDFAADVIVEDSVIVELKSVTKLAEAHEVQLVNYLAATGKPVGLLLNFGPERVDVKRKYRDYRPNT